MLSVRELKVIVPNLSVIVEDKYYLNIEEGNSLIVSTSKKGHPILKHPNKKYGWVRYIPEHLTNGYKINRYRRIKNRKERDSF